MRGDAAAVQADRRVLDVATGPGVAAAGAQARGAAVIGVDVSPGMVALAHLRQGNRRPAGGRVVAEAVGWAAGAVLVPYTAMVVYNGGSVISQLWIGCLTVATATAAFAGWQGRMDDCPTDTLRWLRQGTLGIAASIIGLGVSLA